MLSSLILSTALLFPGQCAGGVCHVAAVPVKVTVRVAAAPVKVVHQARPVRRVLHRVFHRRH
jgi:hypothetical protein